MSLKVCNDTEDGQRSFIMKGNIVVFGCHCCESDLIEYNMISLCLDLRTYHVAKFVGGKIYFLSFPNVCISISVMCLFTNKLNYLQV